MPKLPALRSREVIKALEGAGFVFVRQKGSHQIYVKRNSRVTVPYHNRDLKIGTLRHIIKQSGLEIREFLKLI